MIKIFEITCELESGETLHVSLAHIWAKDAVESVQRMLGGVKVVPGTWTAQEIEIRTIGEVETFKEE